MSSIEKLTNFLDYSNINYNLLHHDATYTCEQLAHKLDVPTKDIAKTVIIKNDKGYAMIVLPGDKKINLSFLKNMFLSNKLELAKESEFKKLFPDCELGAMPPFGNLYKLPVYVAHSLTLDSEIIFNAGTHCDAIKMKFDDYTRIVSPNISFLSKSIH
jgi:Ala-tRNA(Pro) deacylase